MPRLFICGVLHMARNTKSRPRFTQAMTLCEAIDNAGGFALYDAEDLEPPPLSHFEALLMQGYTAEQIIRSCTVPAIDDMSPGEHAFWNGERMRH